MEGLSKRYASLLERSDSYEKEAGGMLNKVNNINETLRKIHGSIDVATEKLQSQEPVGGNLAAIKDQQEHLRVNYTLGSFSFFFFHIIQYSTF